MSIHEESRFYPKKLIAALLAAVIVAAVIISALFAISDLNSVKNGGSFEITDGMSVSQVASGLKKEGIIRFSTVFQAVSRMENYDRKIKPGTIEVKKGMSYSDILLLCVNAQPKLNKIVIPEGYEVKEIAQTVSSLVSQEDFYSALSEDYDYKFLENLPEREVKLEGYLFPATYEFKDGVTAREIVDAMLKAFDEHFPEEYYSHAKELNMTTDEIVTLASIIERESASGEERPKIAGVFYNRLKINMRLQSCATVQYILKERKANLSAADTKIKSPYNTYLHEGLPPGPIASPGEECIKAALYPEKTDALYFVLGSDGKHIFSKTYEEHLKAKDGKAE